ncbi:FtsB family cell division protein [Limnochorda pilosa]|uniref:Septum formation initiator n=1 Tax=Limnochorda pilosa TaxID=1555112 RepID=A0A0K2SQW0_LIMPI|nr:septum formation initiator family protein [Limnochorda pilosa]BAS29397.1 hypothetical protein LIP_3588 [Limnochorda pilosa]
MASRRRFKVTNRFFALLLTVVLLSLGIRWIQGFVAQRGLEREMEALQADLDATRGRAAQLEAEVSEMRSDAYVERKAREELGLVKPGEERYQVVPAQEDESATESR